MSMFSGRAEGRGITLLDQGGLAHALRREVGDTQSLFNVGVKFQVAADVLVTLLDSFDLLTEPARAHHPPNLQIAATLFAVADFQRLRCERYGDTDGENAWAACAQQMGEILRAEGERLPNEGMTGTQEVAYLAEQIDRLTHRLVDGGDGTRTAGD